MFSGIVDHTGIITAIKAQSDSLQATIKCNFEQLEPGESIAVDGICLTVTTLQPFHFCCDISPETLALTTAKDFAVGHTVNIERALRVGDRLGGHWVMGHVDQTATISKITPQQDFIEMQVTGIPAENMAYLHKKGSIALNGVSLTINEVPQGGLKVMLIPHTLERTNLSQLVVGSSVNVEFDWMARVIVNQYRQLEISGK